jgi:hypothetical protein
MYPILLCQIVKRINKISKWIVYEIHKCVHRKKYKNCLWFIPLSNTAYAQKVIYKNLFLYLDEYIYKYKIHSVVYI